MNYTGMNASVIVAVGDVIVVGVRLGELILQIPSNFVYVARDAVLGFRLIRPSDIRARSTVEQMHVLAVAVRMMIRSPG